MHIFTTPGKTRVVVINPVDSVELTTDGGDTTTVELLPQGTEGEAIADETSVTSTDGDGTHIVTVTLPGRRAPRLRRSGLDIRITAPLNVDVVVTTNGNEHSLLSIARGSSGDIRLYGSVGDVDVSIPRGDVSAQTVTGSLSVKTTGGDVSANVVYGTVKVRSVSGDVSIEEASGDVAVTVVSGDVSITSAKGSVDVTSVSGDVIVAEAFNGATSKSTSGDVTIRKAWSGSVRVATVSGDLTVGVPSGRGVSVDARSMSGDLTSEISLDDSSGPSGSGDTVVKISANSVSGDVTIQRAAGASS